MRGLVGGVAVITLLWVNHAQAAISSFNWQPIPLQSGEIANIVWSPSNPDILYLGVEVNAHSFYKSKDGGKTWRRIDSGDHTKDVAVHPANPDIAFYSDSQSLWRTESGGEVAIPKSGPCDPHREKCSSPFQKVIESQFQAGPTGFATIAIAPSDPSVIYVGVPRLDLGPLGTNQNAGQLHKSTDGGVTFTQVKTKAPGINVIAIDPNKAQRILIGGNDGIYRSENGGVDIKQITSARAVSDIHTVNGIDYLAASEEGLYRSTDGGVSWQKPDQPTKYKSTRVKFSLSNPSVAWATTSDGVFSSTDGGKNWQDVSSNLKAKNFQALAVHPKNPDIALIATDTFIFSIRSTGLFRQGQYYNQGIYRTEDGGKSWVRSDQGLMEDNLIDVTTHPSRPFEVWAAQQSSRGLYRSRDAGQTWSLTPHLLTHYPMRLVFFPNDKSGNKIAHTSLHTGEDFGITADSGINWSTQSEKAFFDVVERGKNLLDTSVMGSSNLHLHGLAIDPKNPDIIYVGSVDDPSTFNAKPLKGAHVFKSVDGGKIWQESDNGYDHEYATSINDIKIDPQNTSTLYVAMTKKESTSGNGVWKSTDAAANWKRSNTGMPDNASVSTLIIHPTRTNELLAATFEGLYKSIDGAGSWQLIKHGQFKDIEYDLSNPDLVYTGSGSEGSLGQTELQGENGVFTSNDFGNNWTNITGNLPSVKVTTVGVSSDGTIVYAGVEGYGLYAAYDSSIGEIQTDDKTGNELGADRGFGDINNQYETGRLGGHGRPPFGGNQPPRWFKAIVIGVGGVMILTIVFVIVRIVKKRHKQ